jgi:hypothetical protein
VAKKLNKEEEAIKYIDGSKEYWGELPMNKAKEITKEGWPKCERNIYGDKIWINEAGEYHREGGPAYEWGDGCKEWYKEGKLHREDGPAIEHINGSKVWYKNGVRHREEGAALENINGNKEYWIEGKEVKEEDLPINKKKELSKCFIDGFGNKFWMNEKGEPYREGGPAIEYVNGNKYWYKGGELHREDGPAAEYSNGDKEYFLNGEKVKEEELPINKKWEYHPADSKLRISQEAAKNLGLSGGNLTKIEWVDGCKEWYKDGKLHREGGPACEYSNGDKVWYKEGVRHREEGAALEFASGNKYYYLNGKQVEEEDLPMKAWPKCEVDENGNKEWRNKEGLFHRENGPAIEYENGNKFWYKEGKLHREGGPACEYSNGDKEYFLNGIKVGPAVEYDNEKEVYYINKEKEEWPKCWKNEKGKLHREDGPAWEWENGDKEWYKEGGLHREDGPAIERADGYKEYWINNKKVEEKDLPINQWPKCTIDKNGVKEWKNEVGEYHREDGPAREFTDGYKSWWMNGKRHRLDGPAIEYANGDKEWHKEGKLHREDGPAIERADGYKEYRINGVKIEDIWTYSGFFEGESKCEIDKSGNKVWKNKNGLYHREGGPAVEWSNGDKSWWINGKCHREDGPAMDRSNSGGYKSWYKDGKLHRLDGPAIEYANGDKEWHKEGKLHREDGPAIERADGYKEYWINDKRVEEKDLPINKEEEWPKCIINEDGDKEWWINGEEIEDMELFEYVCECIFEGESKCTIDENRNKVWRNKAGEYHREGGPAIEYVNGSKSWLINGKYHREGGPAIECANGDKEWWINGLRHREDGPAVEFINGDKFWFKNGGQVEEKDLLINKTEKLSKCWEYHPKPSDFCFSTPNINSLKLPINKSSSKAYNIIKEDSKKVIYRTISKQGIKLVKNSILGLMRVRNIKNDQIKAIEKFLNTEIGYGMMSFILGAALTYTPMIRENKYIGKISKEMRVDGIAGAGQFITGEILEKIIKGNEISKDWIQEDLREIEENIEDEEIGKAELIIN